MRFKEEENVEEAKNIRREYVNSCHDSTDEYEDEGPGEILSILDSLDVSNQDPILNTKIQLLAEYPSSFFIPEEILDNFCSLFLSTPINNGLIPFSIELLNCCDNQDDLISRLLDDKCFNVIEAEIVGENSSAALFLLRKLLHFPNTNKQKLEVLPILRFFDRKVYLDILTTLDVITPYFFNDGIKVIKEIAESGEMESAAEYLHNFTCFLNFMGEESFESISELTNDMIDSSKEAAITAISFLNFLLKLSPCGIKYFQIYGIDRILHTVSLENDFLAENSLRCLSAILRNEEILSTYIDDVIQMIDSIYIDCQYRNRTLLLEIIITMLSSSCSIIREKILFSELLHNAGILLSAENEPLVVFFLEAFNKAIRGSSPELFESFIDSKLFETIAEIASETENVDIMGFIDSFNS